LPPDGEVVISPGQAAFDGLRERLHSLDRGLDIQLRNKALLKVRAPLDQSIYQPFDVLLHLDEACVRACTGRLHAHENVSLRIMSNN